MPPGPTAVVKNAVIILSVSCPLLHRVLMLNPCSEVSQPPVA